MQDGDAEQLLVQARIEEITNRRNKWNPEGCMGSGIPHSSMPLLLWKQRHKSILLLSMWKSYLVSWVRSVSHFVVPEFFGTSCIFVFWIIVLYFYIAHVALEIINNICKTKWDWQSRRKILRKTTEDKELGQTALRKNKDKLKQNVRHKISIQQ